MSKLTLNRPGLILSQPLTRTFKTAPLAAGESVSWLAWARYGDNQGDNGACIMGAFANWCECVARAKPDGIETGRGTVKGIPGGRNITNKEMIAAYYDATGGEDIGLAYPEGYLCSRRYAWHSGSTLLRACKSDELLVNQPLLLGLEITEDWTRSGNVEGDGRFKSTKSTRSLGHHAVLQIGKGAPPQWGGGTFIYILTPWRLDDGTPWGWNGVAALPQEYVAEWCREVWALG
jgi:hypothetical protein